MSKPQFEECPTIASQADSDRPIFVNGFARAVGGALLFSMPLLMTMEMWEIAVEVARWRLVILAVATVVLTFALTRHVGPVGGGVTWMSTMVDTGVALVAGTLVATGLLTVLGVIDLFGDPWDAFSVVTMEALPASLGASYARAQLGKSGADPSGPSYGRELFLMLAGAVIFASNLAPTEEIVLLSGRIGEWRPVFVLLLSITLLHGLVYTAGFRGQEEESPGRAFLNFTLPGYAIALGVSAFMLWTLGRYDETAYGVALLQALVLALPASLGAGAARLIL